MNEYNEVLDEKDEVRLCYDPKANELFFEMFSFFGIWQRFEPEDYQIPDFNDYSDGFRLDFTGKISLIVEQVGFGPMHIKINDLELTKKIVLVALEGIRTIEGHTIDAYGDEEEELLKNVLSIPQLTQEEYQAWLDKHAV